MDFSPELQLYDSVNSSMAAAYLGVSLATLRRLRRTGLLPAFSVESQVSGKEIWRFRMVDVHLFRANRQNYLRVWDPRSSEMPATAVARLLGISVAAVWQARSRGSLRSYTPLDVRRYLERTLRRKIGRQLKAEIKRLRMGTTHLRRQATESPRV